MLNCFRKLIVLSVFGFALPTCLAAQEATDQVTITADPTLQVLTLRGSHDAVQKTQRVIAKIQRPREMVNIGVTFAVSDTETGKKKIVDEIKLSALDGEKASVEFGREVAVVNGRMLSRYGSQKTVEMKQVGTIIKVVPQVTAQGVIVELLAEKSWIDPSNSTTDDDIDAPSPAYTAQCETTILLAAGQSQTLQALVSGGTDSGRVMLITVSASTGSQQQKRSDARRSSSAKSDTSAKQPDEQSSNTSSKRSTSPEKEASKSGTGASRGRGRSGGGSADRRSAEAGRAAGVDAIAERMFEKFDSNSNGKLDSEELEKLPKSLQDSVVKAGQSSDEFGKKFADYIKNRTRSRTPSSDD